MSSREPPRRLIDDFCQRAHVLVGNGQTGEQLLAKHRIGEAARLPLGFRI